MQVKKQAVNMHQSGTKSSNKPSQRKEWALKNVPFLCKYEDPSESIQVQVLIFKERSENFLQYL